MVEVPGSSDDILDQGKLSFTIESRKHIGRWQCDAHLVGIRRLIQKALQVREA
jgi:hypothetical protein